MSIKKENIILFINNFTDQLIKNKDELTELDRVIGDADHGINMERGATAIQENINSYNEKTLEEIFKDIGLTLIKTVGGASGPLYGTAFMNAANELKGKEEITNEELITILETMISGIKHRGKALLGDKTMLDALIPASKAYKKALESNKSLKSSLEEAATEAWKGTEYTKSIKANKGRASYLGDRSIDHQDPGATSMSYLIQALADSIEVDEEITEDHVNTDDYSVGIVIVSHSKKVAEGAKEIALEMAPGAKIACAGGYGEDNIGTDLQKTIDAIEKVESPSGVIILVDLGSALMTAQMAIEATHLDNVEIIDAPIVEGAIFAAIESSIGSDIDKIKEVLEKLKSEPKF